MTSPSRPAADPEVFVVGEALVALIASDVGPMATTGGFTAHVAGAAYNVAVALARQGIDVGLLGRVGWDAMGEQGDAGAAAEDISVAEVVRDDSPTALLLRSRPSEGAAEAW